MKNLFFPLFIAILIAGCSEKQNNPSFPHLQKKGTATQLIVDDRPFLILGGELGNSSSSTSVYMDSIWPTLEQLNLNTILAPVYWELIEPEEGIFNFTIVEDLILDARARDIRLVFLWFGSWKNSMSCYAPAWVKNSIERFPRVRDAENHPVEILSPFVEANLEADKNAFTELMKFIKEVDGMHHTVIMVQVENEIGMLPSARDHHPLANEAFEGPVPLEFVEWLEENKSNLKPEFYDVWGQNGFKTGGSWSDIFGEGPSSEEIFMAWFFGQYTNEIASAGKEVYPLPMYVNAALNRPGWLPGQYPSAGPLPHLMDVWQAAAPDIDFLSPDIYFPDLEKWYDMYVRGGNPLFVPEHRFDASCGAKAFFTVGKYDAIGFSPFSIESTSDPLNELVAKAYGALEQLSPVILEKQGEDLIRGILLDKIDQRDTISLGGYKIIAKHDYTLGWSPGAREEVWPHAGGIIICIGEGEYYVAGEGIVLNFPGSEDGMECTGIETIEEGYFKNGEWTVVRIMNGDQSHQGRHLRIPIGETGIQYLKLYRYK